MWLKILRFIMIVWKFIYGFLKKLFFQIYSRRFVGSSSERAESDSFVIDPFSGLSTELEVYFPDSAESHIKSLSVSDTRSTRFSTVMDTTQALHYYSLYNVPFKAEGEGGMRWNYSLVRLPSDSLDNVHVVQVTSAPSPHQGLEVHLTTNILDYQANLSPEKPLILFAEVKLNQRPVLNARVVAEVGGTNRAGLPIPATELVLTDSGSGDPDKFSGDGVYSRYMTSIDEEGIYTISLHVSSSRFSPAGLQTVSGVSTLPEFSRIVSGFSFRVESLKRSSKDSFPPSRIVDLSVTELIGSQELELRWTAPGDDYDSGAPSSYQIYYSEDPASFYLDGAPPQLVERFTGDIPAGQQDQHRINVQGFNKDLYYAIVAVDDQDNVGQISNIVRAYMHRPYIIPSGHSTAGIGNLRKGLFNPFEVIEGPNRIIMYAIVGVVTMVVLTFIVVTIIVVVSRKLKRREQEDVDVTSNQNGSFKDSDLLRFSSVDLNVNKETKPDNFIPRIDPYTELITDSNYTSQDRLFYSSENLYHQVKITRADLDPSMNTTAIYAKPLPKNERKSILKKPREDGDGDSEPSDISEESECANSYLETDFDIASLRKGPPTLPKPTKPDTAPREQVYSPIFIDAPEFNPPLCSTDSMYCSVYVQEQQMVQNLDLTQHLQGSPSVGSPDVLSLTNKRVRNCTQV